MSDFFDSSVVIGVIVADCPEHADCLKAWNASEHKVIYSHALLETFCQLTGGRLGKAVSPDVAAESITRNFSRPEVLLLTLSPEEIMEHLGEARKQGVRGGAVYDYMHLCAARKGRAKRIFTLNKRHFLAIAPDLAERMIDPTED